MVYGNGQWQNYLPFDPDITALFFDYKLRRAAVYWSVIDKN